MAADRYVSLLPLLLLSLLPLSLLLICYVAQDFLLQVHSGNIMQPMVEGIGLSGKDRAYLPTRGKLRLHIDADMFKVAGDASHTRTACGAAPAGNLGSYHPNRQQPKQPRKPKQPGSGRPSKHVVVLAVMGLVLQGCNDDISF